MTRSSTQRALLSAATVLFGVLAPTCLPRVHADTASVLPKGTFSVMAESTFYLPITERYDPDGDIEDAATDFNTSLDSRVFPALRLLDPLVGRASFGDTDVSFEYRFTILELGFQYGLTDRLTVGISIPYWWGQNDVRAQLNSGPGSSANVGLNPGVGPPIIPIAAGGVPLTTEDVQQLLGPGLRGIPGFGFKRFESWSDSDFGDLEVGGRYQYFRSADWQLAFTGGVRFPTGRVDDPDNLVDWGFGSGAYALLFRLNNDFVVSNLWTRTQASSETPADFARPGTLVLNGTFRYDLVLPDKEEKRVPDDVNNPLTVNKEEVYRDLGDVFEFEASARYTLFAGLTLSALYRYGFKLQDDISGTRGFAYSELENESDYTEHIFIVGLSYSTIPLYLAKKFPVPLTFSIAYRNRFAGSNNVLRSEYIRAGLQILF